MTISNIPFAAKPAALALIASICMAAGGPAARAQNDQIVGRPRVIDADTLDFAGNRVDLSGIDGPEIGQTCGAGAAVWNCGLEARWALLNRVGQHWVTCVPQGPPEGLAEAGPRRAVCYLAGVGQLDVGAWLVAEGWALAEREAAGGAYLVEEAAAQKSGKGLWRGVFTAPWDWRRGQKSKD